MRDITTDLEERIRAEERSCLDLEQQLSKKREHIDLLKRLLSLEGAPKSTFKANGTATTAHALIPLHDFIIEQTKDTPLTKDQIKDAAELVGYFTAQKGSPGRTVHAIVVSLLKAGKLEHVSHGYTGKNAKYRAVVVGNKQNGEVRAAA